MLEISQALVIGKTIECHLYAFFQLSSREQQPKKFAGKQAHSAGYFGECVFGFKLAKAQIKTNPGKICPIQRGFINNDISSKQSIR